MSKAVTQARLIKVWEMLKQGSDCDKPMTTNQIIEKLAEENITADRRTIYNDIDTLNKAGYEVMEIKGPYQANQYYVEDRDFDITELGVLIDSIQAANFLSEKKSKELIRKIALLGGSNKAEILRVSKIDFNTTKHSNEEIYYNVDSIQRAILENKKIGFFYFDFNEKGEKVFRKNHNQYVVSPVATLINDNNYYFMAYHKSHDSIATYRIDRMLKVEELEEDADEVASSYRKDVSKNRKQAFNMYSGRAEEVTFELDISLISTFYDKFGEKIHFNNNNGIITCTQKVMVSDVFYGWCCSFGKKVKITYPHNVVEEMKAYLKNIENNYQSEE